MKKKVIFELSWLIGLLILSFLLSLIPANRALDINMHDTYIMVDGHTYSPTLNSYPVVLYILILCLVYFVRCITGRFSNIVVNIGLLISTAIAIFFFGDIVITFTVVQMHFASIANIRQWFYTLRLALWIILVFDVFMIGWNWRKRLRLR
ncbi:MAG: hypothetical protein V4577_11310 [Bacteroidota bacterium]